MKTIVIRFIFIFYVVTLLSCEKKLNLFPTNDLTAEKVFATPLGYKQALAKIYVSLAVTGTNGRDIPAEIVLDEGSTGFLRQLWYLQCLTTDEAGWTYSGSTDPIGMHQMSWTASSQTIAGLYFRCFYLVTLCNNFIKESSEDKVASRGISGTDAADIKRYRAEARFVRAYSYWVLLDNFGNVPFTDENYVIGSGVSPKQMTRATLFNYIEAELKAIDEELAAPRTNENGRADQAAAWALLARMYLNAVVYSGSEKYTEAIVYAKQVINAGYTLHNDYTQLLLADNDRLTNEFIWTIRFDGTHTQSYSGTTFLVHGQAGVPAAMTGTNGSWDCIRMTEQFVDKFNSQDVRGQFWTQNQRREMDVLLGDARAGYSSSKFRNLTQTGKIGPGTDAGGTFVDVDFPVFRLAEIYLIYAEAVVRGGSSGENGTALNYLQALAKRARPSNPNAGGTAVLSADYILDERGRELFWECHRRTDLIRYGRFTTNTYLWSWKGGIRSGTAVDPKYNLFPIPAIDITSNPGITQNSGY
ncbi:RagB/SusD family nutrient uptake outer membrane protein [Niabella beijingensis]|uniref:RagB/SusD family nutrient uptake outer membrane protein n=1 Tax=Niabella beijingensis TaxID=2872700 RepID=UPI001CBF980A|nr:RagB/SusD family nutrient uptake outer membrane protein [Niabella beijingensis]MBZ4189738.1 RagB/SusD family nutrient uptake outer membrane protein [Niabella beijingensis]